MRLPAIVLRSSIILAAFAALPLTVHAQQASAGGRQMLPADLRAWKSIRQSALSNDGKWFAYTVAPNEGDASLTVREIAENGKSYTFNVGSSGAGGRAGGPGGAANASVAFSGDSKWVAFIIAPPEPAAGAGGRGGRGGRGGAGAGAAPSTPAQDKLGLVNLATGEKREFDKVRRFAFNGDQPTWLAMQSFPPTPEPAAGAAGRGAGAADQTERSLGTDLVLYKLGSGEMINVGNVGEFGFDESGTWLAYTIDAHDRVGNGVQLRNMKTDVVRVADNDQALYRHLVWADSQPALAVLRGRPDSVSRDTAFALVTVQGLDGASFNKHVLDPSAHSEFPAGMKIVADRAPRFSEDLSTVFIGIRARNKAPAAARTLASNNGRELIQAGAPGNGGTVNQPRTGPDNAETLPSLILWNSLDSRLQSQQIVQEAADRSFNYLAEYRAPDDKFVVLADSALRSVSTTGRDQFAFGGDTRSYDWAASFNGRRYEDLYSVDLKTGARKELLKKHLTEGAQMPSPDGRSLLYWGEDANWWVADLASGEEHEVTKTSGVSFVNTEDDHNNLVPPPYAPLGWSKDGSAVLLSDGWDIYRVAVKTGQATNLTVNGKRDQIRYQRIYNFDRSGGGGGGRAGGAGFGGGGRVEGIDLSKPLYVATYGEWTKKTGLSRVDPGKAGATPLVWEDAAISFQKARDADVYVYTRQTNVEFPDYYVANPGFKGGRRLTDANPQQKDFAWSSGVKLIDYTSDKGDKLQGALYLPANYQPGKKYPLLVTIYEKRSDLAHMYVVPNETSTPNRSIYTSRGYAVLDPDIVYRVNDPGMSAVWCVIPAVKAAIATGMIDEKDIGLWGHSWGGYQTAFLVTQTDIFKAAIAGAPLTDMVSMYSSIYWNSGGTNQAIFESSQGRFKGNFLDNEEAYLRNSPVFHANNVKTPLIILSDDKDGAVDFNQGITYFNTLRQLGKKVILFEYVGENHGLARPVNQKDYAIRQREWFDAYLKGATPPDWMTKGIPRLEMDEHLRERANAAVTPIP